MKHFNVFLLFLLCGFTFGVSSSFAEDRKSLLEIQQITTQKGITAWLVEDNSVPVISMQFAFVGAGAVNDPDEKQGLAQLLSNTMDEGADDLDSQAFQKELQDLSISLSFNSSRDHFGGSLKTLTKNSIRAFNLLEMAIMRPRFDEEPVQRMRQSNQSRIRSSLSNPDWIAARILNDKAFSGHPYARNSGGTLSSLDAITSDDLHQFHRKHLGKNNLVVAVSGDINAERLKTVLDNVFAGLADVDTPEVESLKLQNVGTISIYEKDIPQTIIEMMQPGIGRDDPDYHAAQVMNFVLGSSGFGSRLTEEIREKQGLTYGIYSSFYGLKALKAMSVSTSTKNENVPKMLAAIQTEFAKMRDKGITQEELNDAKSYLIGSLPLSLTSTDRISGLMVSLMRDNLPIDYLDQREAAIKAMTLEDIAAVSKRILDPNGFVSVLVGQPEGDALSWLGEIQSVEALTNVE
ncbi:MAG: M16 family metallopeptidase [Bdellovibrionales bacterium]